MAHRLGSGVRVATCFDHRELIRPVSFDGFLTFLTLIAALYAIAPAITRLSIRLRSVVAATLSLGAFALVLYFLLFDTLGQPCELHATACRSLVFDPPRTITPNQAAFLVVIAWLALMMWMLLRSRLSASALPGLARVVSELADEQRYAELIKFAEPNLPLLDRAAARKLTIQRAFDVVRRWHPTRARIEDLIAVAKKEKLPRSRMKQFAARALLPVLPKGERAESAAKEVLRRLMRTPALSEHVARYRADFGVKLLSLSAYGVHDFAHRYLALLMKETGSSLYEEIADNQNIDLRGYMLAERNRLLHFLFSDVKRAEHLGVWQPVGEHAIASLRRDMRPDYVAFLNGSAEGFEEERWLDPVFVSIRFFDIMVQAALFQGINWHMWLFYMSNINDSLVANYDDSDPNVDRLAEWPTRSSYLIYQVFSALADWIKAAENLQPGEHHLNLENERVDHENGNIPKSAALCLAQCMRTLLLSANVPQRFKRYIAHMILRDISHLQRQGPMARIRAATINAIARGGVLSKDSAYGTELRAALASADHFLRADLPDLAAALDAEYPP